LLVLIAGVVLAFSRGIFDLVLGMNPLGLRVVTDAGLLTDEHPAFRLDTAAYESGAVTGGATAGPMPGGGGDT
jgi:hypothetical protein